MTSEERTAEIQRLNKAAEGLSILEKERNELESMTYPEFKLKSGNRSSLDSMTLRNAIRGAYEEAIAKTTELIRISAATLAGEKAAVVATERPQESGFPMTDTACVSHLHGIPQC